MLAQSLQLLLHVLVGDFDFRRLYRQAFELAQGKLRQHLEAGLEAQRLCRLKLELGNRRVADRIEVALSEGVL